MFRTNALSNALPKIFALVLCAALIPAVANAQLRPVSSAEIFHGEIDVTQEGALDLVVHLDRASTAGETVADQVFVFRSEVPLPAQLDELDGPARIVVRPDAVLLLPEGQPILALRTGAADLTPAHDGSEARVLNGYQLSRFESTSDEYLQNAVEGALEESSHSFRPVSDQELRRAFGEATLLAVDDDDCTSGGTGAETCEISGPAGECDATCNPGYDACCNQDGCGCREAS